MSPFVSSLLYFIGGGLVGAGIGDAMGAPTEGFSKQDLEDMYLGKKIRINVPAVVQNGTKMKVKNMFVSIRKILVILVIIFLSMNTFATTDLDDDEAAFITKSEFDSF
mgnify:CR=1 FL=1